jgi:uncharacterized protein YdeI (YjbR/CyaY-like superfamily)
MNPKVDWFFNKAKKWQEEYDRLRVIVLDCGLTEELKWGCPCYTYENSNIVLIHGFKEYCALLFMKGSLLKDTKGILVQQTKNVQAARQIRFTHIDEIIKMESILKNYIKEAIKVEKAGLKVPLKKVSEFTIAEEFRTALDETPALKKAFSLHQDFKRIPSLLFFRQTVKTREARIEKTSPIFLRERPGRLIVSYVVVIDDTLVYNPYI